MPAVIYVAVIVSGEKRRRFVSSEGGNLRRRHHSYEREIEPSEERVLLDVGGAAL